MLGRTEGQVTVSGVYPFGAFGVALFWRGPTWFSVVTVFETSGTIKGFAADYAQVNVRQQVWGAVKHNLP